jgi:hypothetical protein
MIGPQTLSPQESRGHTKMVSIALLLDSYVLDQEANEATGVYIDILDNIDGSELVSVALYRACADFTITGERTPRRSNKDT